MRWISGGFGKQRVETIQIVRALTWPGYGWANHPAVLSGRDSRKRSAATADLLRRLDRSGFGDTCALTITTDLREAGVDPSARSRSWPRRVDCRPGSARSALHRSHRSALLRKDEENYRPLFPEIPSRPALRVAGPLRGRPRSGAAQNGEPDTTRASRGPTEQVEAERLRRRRSRAAKKAWVTRGPAATSARAVEDLVQPGGEGLRLTGIAALAAEEASVVARELGERWSPRLGGSCRRPSGEGGARLDADRDDHPSRSCVERLHVGAVAGDRVARPGRGGSSRAPSSSVGSPIRNRSGSG